MGGGFQGERLFVSGVLVTLSYIELDGLLPDMSLLVGALAGVPDELPPSSIFSISIFKFSALSPWFPVFSHGLDRDCRMDAVGDTVGLGGLSLMSSLMPGIGRPCSSISSTCMYDIGALSSSLDDSRALEIPLAGWVIGSKV